MKASVAAERGFGAYRPRAVYFKGLRQQPGWTIKTYIIESGSGSPTDEIFRKACETALPTLPAAGSETLGLIAHGYGILTLHCGTLANWLLLNWWVGGSILRQRLFRSEVEMPLAFSEITDIGLVACVWEFGVLDFERRAWIDTMMQPDGPDTVRYLATVLDGQV